MLLIFLNYNHIQFNYLIWFYISRLIEWFLKARLQFSNCITTKKTRIKRQLPCPGPLKRQLPGPCPKNTSLGNQLNFRTTKHAKTNIIKSKHINLQSLYVLFTKLSFALFVQRQKLFKIQSHMFNSGVYIYIHVYIWNLYIYIYIYIYIHMFFDILNVFWYMLINFNT